MRGSKLERTTNETRISVTVNLDRPGDVPVDTGIAFFDHMLSACAKHGRFDLGVVAEGDLEIDSHHLVEDCGIVIGKALKEAIGDGRGIRRFAHCAVPMDEAIAWVTLDPGGRGYLVYRGSFSEIPLGGKIPGDLIEHFFYSLCINAGITAHITFEGRNDHHKCEAVFKAFGIAFGQAAGIDAERTEIPSTKGTL
jgi:imidazoleglycerol phosphate dehydratase HisB